ncbi:glycosyltransferase family 2 protein [Jannaschia seohaensis]|uniref:Glycosyl transferase family 2 n=1 Tax=Jannaschia seohaensis TaxID=475081 RepID=A0A2Y9A2H2_9RHOB|nr:glycosyltransferase family 2 protein [Jannaschia seohaensis]PWJ21778.1 glycosyl transferase family 2 [Jannaschia seohaensis]SSA38056.1 Glycosyl transferase family 2 [Jannaschia seohaensis]
MGIVSAYRMRLRRKLWLTRARLKAGQLSPVANRTGAIRGGDLLAFTTLRDERLRLPYFLDYYRRLGIDHFLMVDNGSTDGTTDYLAAQPDVSLWRTEHSYRGSAYGVDWLNGLARRHGARHWCLTVDVDEFLVYPFCDTRPLRALTDWLDASQLRVFGAMLLDMYPKGPLAAQPYAEGQDPFEIAQWFDAGNYVAEKNPLYDNLWIQGGVRAREFFADRPRRAPALNKTPLVKWARGYAYVSSTHALLPRGLNRTYEEAGGEKASGVLLHAKFLDTFGARAEEEAARGEHYRAAEEYRAYAGVLGDGLDEGRDLWCRWSERYVNWRQLEILGLISKGNWA